MRDINEIIKELQNHPDYVYSNIWTINDCIEYQLENFANDMNYDEEMEHLDMLQAIKSDDVIDYIGKDNLKPLKEIYNDGLEDWNYRAWEFVGSEFFPNITEMNWFEGFKRELKLKKILKDGNK